MRLKLVYVIPLILLGVAIGAIISPLVSGDNVYNQFEKYSKVFGITTKNYVDEVDTQKLTESAIRGMLGELDPHSVYITAEDMKEVKEEFQGSFDGIGVQFDMINDTISIVLPIIGGPSEAVGILAGDKIIQIDGKNVVGIDRNEVPKLLKGPKGTIVKVDIKRGSRPDLLSFSITRDKIPLYSVDASFMFDNSDIGFVRVNKFAENTFTELNDALKKLQVQGMKKLILDLRGNPGGFLQQAFLMASEFLGIGDTIVYTKGRKPEFDEYLISPKKGEYSDLPLIILVNHGSASASEIVSGAIQDLDRGLILGTTSFGKGLVQRQYDIGDGSAFRLTISRYYTPSGRSIQRPYKDKEGYRKLAGMLEVEEGSNIEHALDKIRKQIKIENDAELVKNPKSKNLINLDSIPMYKTRKGRIVLGGGGITPDYVIKSDTLTELSVQLRMNRIFYEYVNNNLQNGTAIKQKYKGDFKQFKSDFKVSDKMIEDFKKLAESKKIKWNDSDYQTDQDFIIAEIKATIASINWGADSRSEMFYSSLDRQVQMALKLFPEAEKISKR
jgi:carboxyl-terminal processing protease